MPLSVYLLDIPCIEKVSVLSPPSRKFYVTLDVVFHEDEMYYSTFEPSFQGENRDKVQTCMSFGKISNYKGDNLKTSCEYPREGDIMDNKSDCSDG